MISYFSFCLFENIFNSPSFWRIFFATNRIQNIEDIIPLTLKRSCSSESNFSDSFYFSFYFSFSLYHPPRLLPPPPPTPPLTLPITTSSVIIFSCRFFIFLAWIFSGIFELQLMFFICLRKFKGICILGLVTIFLCFLSPLLCFPNLYFLLSSGYFLLAFYPSD